MQDQEGKIDLFWIHLIIALSFRFRLLVYDKGLLMDKKEIDQLQKMQI